MKRFHGLFGLLGAVLIWMSTGCALSMEPSPTDHMAGEATSNPPSHIITDST